MDVIQGEENVIMENYNRSIFNREIRDLSSETAGLVADGGDIVEVRALLLAIHKRDE